jgi:hypothetical protein
MTGRNVALFSLSSLALVSSLNGCTNGSIGDVSDRDIIGGSSASVGGASSSGGAASPHGGAASASGGSAGTGTGSVGNTGTLGSGGTTTGTSVGGSTGSAGAATVGGGDTISTAARGATVPYFEYEAEAATTTGTVLPASRTFGEIASEASGRSAVRLDSVGQAVTFTLQHPANSIVVRYSIPDGQSDVTLGLYVNGVRKTSLHLTARYSWTYGDADAQGAGSESTSAGTAHHFYDEAHALLDAVPAGATVTLKKDAQDSSPSYTIDLADFELVPAPLAQPAGSLSITDFGATPDDGSDDGAAIQRAIAAAQAQGKTLWIPNGTFNGSPKPAQAPWPKLVVAGVTIRGAGMWYSTIQGFGAQFIVTGNNNQFYDFALFGDVTYRDDNMGWQGFDGPAGTGSRLENVWIEHQTVGFWVGKGGFVGPVTQALTDGPRIRDTYADGVNFADATKNSVVEQSSFRNTGDDSIATWSFSADGPLPTTNNTFRFNTVQAVWRANCLAVYGGQDNHIEDNTCADTSNYPGLMISTTFSAIPFTGTTTAARNTLTRAGGMHYNNQEFGALRFMADTQPITNVNVSDIAIESPTYSGIQFGGSENVSSVNIDGVTISDYGDSGIRINSESHGSAMANNVTVTGSLNKGLQNDAPSAFQMEKGNGNAGW